MIYFEAGKKYRFSTFSGDVIQAEVLRAEGLRVSIRFRNEETFFELVFVGDCSAIDDIVYISLQTGEAMPVTNDEFVLFASEVIPPLPSATLPEQVFVPGRRYTSGYNDIFGTWFFRLVKRDDFRASGFVYQDGTEPIFATGDLFNVSGREVIYFERALCPCRFDAKEYAK